MIPAGPSIEYRRLRAPRGHGEMLVDPPFASAHHWLESNRALAAASDSQFQGRSTRELALAVRRELVELARRYTHAYRDASPGDESLSATNLVELPLVLTGHQPHLFHPGVWFKNFAADRIAKSCGAVAINLLIDNDTLRSAALKVPTGSATAPRVEMVPFDRPTDEVPFEERPIHDAATFASFGRRAAESLFSLIPNPLLHDVWPRALRAAKSSATLGQSLAQARHDLEFAWGLRTLEVPLSQVCDGDSFRWFAAHLLAHAPRLRDVHNAALVEYRRVHRIRSRSHPVPDLALEDSWIEAPFWVWTSAEPRRRRLFTRRDRRTVHLTDRQQLQWSLDLAEDGSAERAVEQLAAWTRAGVKLRPRAIVTTMFARCFASDLFLHGIGGAKYDQLTDVIMRRFLLREPPAFVTLTLTAQLPIPHEVATRDDVRRAASHLREWRFHPERFIVGEASSEVAALVEQKRHWLAQQPPRGQGRERHEALGRINETLTTLLDDRREQLVEQRDQLAVLAARHAMLASREYSFCLFPEDCLRALLIG